MEDLDRSNSSTQIAERQLRDLDLLGVTSDAKVIFQSDRFDLYREWVRNLSNRGLTYPCFCSRRDVQSALSAPHGSSNLYPGKCRALSDRERRERARERPAAIRIRTTEVARVNGVDDIVLVRNDGVPAYNLAVVIDDFLQGVTQVVRGDDLEHVTPSQMYLQSLLGFSHPEYAHLPLLVGPDGQRLAKRHGDVTLADCLRLGFSADQVRRALLRSFEVGSNGWTPSSSLSEWLKSLL